MSTETTESTWTAEDVEELARWMGWHTLECALPQLWWSGPERRVRYGPQAAEACAAWRESGLWSPFTDASADYMVLERAREVWGKQMRTEWTGDNYAARKAWVDFSERTDLGMSAYYVVGDWSRAVLSVLKSQRKEEP